MFDTLGSAKKLEGVGFSREQAETTVQILTDLMMENLATKDDLKTLGNATKRDIQEVRHEMKKDIQEVRHEMRELKSEIIIKTGAMQAASIAIIVALLKLF